jgi:Raf kinase inhibitor-like YbhB/YbcL family protein
MKALLSFFFAITLIVCLAFDAHCESKKKTAPGASLTIKSTAFTDGASIPKTYTCSGGNYSPALQWSNAPEGTKSFAIIVDDLDAPLNVFAHWVLYNLPATQTSLAEKTSPNGTLPEGALQGVNGFGKIGYGGPCPPPGKSHRYFFKLYALDSMLKEKSGVTKEKLVQAMKGHILAQAQMIGLFEK